MKTLVIAEKPSVGRELSRVLKCNKKSKTCIEGSNYIVTWAMGHLVELAEPGAYNDNWKAWNLESLPMLPDRMKHHVIGRTSQQFRSIKSLLHRKDVNMVIIATDAGREGELVARWILRLCGWKGSFKRLWISSQTDKAILDGFAHLKDGRLYDNLLYAAESRAEADWIVGLNVTRALSCKYDARLSAGRVQTPTLAMIINREDEITRFQPQPFWTIEVDLGHFRALWTGSGGNTRLTGQKQAREIADKLTDSTAVVKDFSIKEKSEPPPLAYDLTALQRDANAILGFSAKKTLQTLQGLYERHKIMTYPRTDSRYITDDIVPTLPARLKAVQASRFSKNIQQILAKPVNPGKRFVDNKKVSDHHAIIPTEEPVIPERLNQDERRLWELIIQRFLAVLSRPYRYNTIRLTLEASGEILRARGHQTIDRGYRKISAGESDDKDDQDDLPDQKIKECHKGDIFTVQKVTVPQGFTRPPARYTEGTLLGAMENPGRFISDASLKTSIQEVKGLGTPATRADIIEKLFSNYYIERHGKELAPTAFGYELLEVVPDLLKKPELTARWELRLANIAKGSEKKGIFLADIRKTASTLIREIKDSKTGYKPRNESKNSCPMCGLKMLTVRDKKGNRLLVCRSRSCGYEEYESGKSSMNKKQTYRQKAKTRKLMNEYGVESKSEGYTLGDMLKAKMEEDKNKKK